MTDFKDSGSNQDKIKNVLDKILTGLAADSNCSGWLKNGSLMISTLMSANNYGSGKFNDDGVAAFAGGRNRDGSETGAPVSSAFTVNTASAFFNAKDTFGNMFTAGAQNYRGGTLEAQAAIVIHELAHILEIDGFKPDFDDEKAGFDNDKLVDKHCGKLIRGLK